ncbi:hypothetical protein FB45DRAFT_1017580 [Roridomyces roridus]|uniref:Uncharacterized protein n=1 Tax=Roridomyces roridus TaxID=1738132 RepID=A0AAD7CIU6_9AGAR|nr:hypothetical protein FB45DRAFT_1017580 [Roridomyces roridus]
MLSASVRRHLARRVLRPALVRGYATPVKEPNPTLNGYPELPDVSHQYRPALGWQDQLLRRNFGDTVHHHEEVHSMWGPDIPVIPPNQALRQFLIAVGCFLTGGLFIKTFLVPESPVIPREYPFNGLEDQLGGGKANPEAESSDE